ncbi:Golgi-to-ER retrieval protein [Tubulinosema ratisbonensis]|uniref:Protein RER1 n=1 Tax=Tubulinosema ratisbonensis TaxID=291195 RepID=A0A437AN54_9MICR|nr:Golgi-to-ER retrieval protein [Tubulinosema ratisbonensis]
MINEILQFYTDRLVPKRSLRWALAGTLILIYYFKILVTGTHYLITYCLSLYLLHGAINFLTPQSESVPDIFDDFDVEYELPTNDDNEFRPFMRRLPEYKLWLMYVQLTGMSLFMSMFEMFDIPVFVPILVVYFIFISILTVRNLFRSMKKYKYNPFFTNKTTFKTGTK